MNNYKFCTKNLDKTGYKEFTHPTKGCPGTNPIIQVHTDLNKKVRIEAPWTKDDIGWFCRMVIKAQEGMNAKLKVKILGTGDYAVAAYHQPNSFSSAYNTHGIVENSLLKPF